jgi:hypothetical protein
VTTTVSNTADTPHSGVLEVSFDGQTVATDPVSVAAGGSETLTFTIERWQVPTQEAAAVLSSDGEVDTARATVDVRPRHEEFVGVVGTDLAIDGDAVFYGGAHGGGNLNSRTSSDDVGGFDSTDDDVYDGEHYVADFVRYAAALGTSVVRIVAAPVEWATNSTVHDGPGEFNGSWFELFDTVVAEAKRNDVRLVVSLMSHDEELAPAPAAYARWPDTVADDLDPDSLNDAF